MNDPYDDGAPARESAERSVARDLAGLPAIEPPEGWEARVRARVRHRRRRTRRVLPLVVAAVATAAAAAAVSGLGVWRGVRRRGAVAAELAVVVEAHRGASRPRGAQPAVGDVLVVSADGGAEVCLYRDDVDLVLRCPHDATCRIDDGRLVGEWRAIAPGTYRAIAFARATPAGASAGSLDAHVAAMRRIGTRVVVSAPIRVR
jgi:hypothetical protein